MTLVRIEVDRPSSGGDIPAQGYVWLTPTRTRTTPTSLVLDSGFQVFLVDGVAEVDLAPTAEWVWKVEERFVGAEKRTWYFTLADSPDTHYYNELIPVDPETLAPTSVTPTPAWFAYVDSLAESSASSLAAVQVARDEATAAKDLTVAQTGNASSYATQAGASATQANTSAANASASATTATQKASEASTSASNAATSATSAASSATTATNARADALGAQSAAELAAFQASNHKTDVTNLKTEVQGFRDEAQTAKSQAENFHSLTVKTGYVDSNGKLILERNDLTRVDAGPVVGPPIQGVVKDVTMGPAAPGTIGPQGLKGEKGDPGGLVATRLVVDQDLDNIITVGLYEVATPSGSSAATANHYPYAEAGSMTVTPSTTGGVLIQTYTTNTKGIYVRRRFSSLWSPWRHFGSSRMDTSAGRAMYAWDEVNQRDQLIYGDTGLRNVGGSIRNTVTTTGGTLYLRRDGRTICLHVVGINFAATASGAVNFIDVGVMPVGFRTILTGLRAAFTSAAGESRIVEAVSDGSVVIYNPTMNVPYSGTLIYQTNDAWPATLPGSSFGSIPNT